MRRHPIIKFFGLAVLYAAFIVGIFVLQFKTETVISKTIGAMRITLAQTENKSNEISLKNQFQLTFRGMTFSSAEKNPVTASNTASNTSEGLILESWNSPDDTSVSLSFTDGTVLTFSTTDTTPDALLNITAQLSKDYDSFTLPYALSRDCTAENLGEGSVLLTQKSAQNVFTAPLIADGRISFFPDNMMASFTAYEPSTAFKFADLAGLPLTGRDAYTQTVQNVRNTVVSGFSKIISEEEFSSATELEATAYLAEMSSRNRYTTALNSIPDSFKHSNKRTYLSAPYFNNLATQNKGLGVQTEKYAAMVENSTATQNLAIFTVDGIADYILREKKTAAIQALLQFPSKKASFEPTVQQAGAMLNVYTRIYRQDSQLASYLESVLPQCLDVIEQAMALEEEKLVLTAAEMSVADRIRLGQSLIDYASICGRSDIADAGRLLVNQYMTADLDLQTVSGLYPVLVQENRFYPHTQILGYYGTRPVWAWTSAPSIEYTIKDDDVVNIAIDYTLSYTHYVIFNGIPTFHAKIEIQNLNFRSDPHYEIYNSSGYVYDEKLGALYLKSRHKSQIELIRLFCDPAKNFTPVKK